MITHAQIQAFFATWAAYCNLQCCHLPDTDYTFHGAGGCKSIEETFVENVVGLRTLFQKIHTYNASVSNKLFFISHTQRQIYGGSFLQIDQRPHTDVTNAVQSRSTSVDLTPPFYEITTS